MEVTKTVNQEQQLKAGTAAVMSSVVMLVGVKHSIDPNQWILFR